MKEQDFINLLKGYPECLFDEKKFRAKLSDFFPRDVQMNNILVDLFHLGLPREIEELEINNPYNPPPTPEKPKKGVKTGDYAHLAAWAAGLVCACVLLIFIWRKRQKRD